MSPTNRRRGVTILEIMIAMSLMSVVIIAFATVFPSGYRLNYANLNQAKATGFANAIVEQISNLSIANVAPYESSASAPVNRAADMLAARRITLPEGLTPPPAAGTSITSSGIFWLESVTIVSLPVTNPFQVDPGAAITNSVLAQISADEVTVSVRWIETRRSAPSIRKTATVTTLMNNVMSR